MLAAAFTARGRCGICHRRRFPQPQRRFPSDGSQLLGHHRPPRKGHVLVASQSEHERTRPFQHIGHRFALRCHDSVQMVLLADVIKAKSLGER